MLDEQDIIATMNYIVDSILIPHFMELGLNATGEWVANVSTRAEGDTGIIRGRQYTEQLVWGRRPGAMPPVAPLEKWAQAKLGLSGTQARSAAFAIAKKIANEGTNIYQEGGTDLLEILETPEVQNKIARYLQNVYAPKVQLAIEREIKNAFA